MILSRTTGLETPSELSRILPWKEIVLKSIPAKEEGMMKESKGKTVNSPVDFG